MLCDCLDKAINMLTLSLGSDCYLIINELAVYAFFEHARDETRVGNLNSWVGIGSVKMDASCNKIALPDTLWTRPCCMLYVENAENTDYNSNMHIAPVRYIADNVDLVLCAHYTKDFFSLILVETACKWFSRLGGVDAQSSTSSLSFI